MSTQLTTVNQTQLQNWAAIIKDCKASGLKVNEYCEQNNISRDTEAVSLDGRCMVYHLLNI